MITKREGHAQTFYSVDVEGETRITIDFVDPAHRYWTPIDRGFRYSFRYLADAERFAREVLA